MDKVQPQIFPLFYLGPTSYYAALINAPGIRFEVKEHFIKQSYRTRCRIYGANGPLNLYVPIERNGKRNSIDELKVVYAEDWLGLHWKSFQSAYRSSPYFEYYEDELRPFYEKPQYETLVDWNLALLDKMLEILETPLTYDRTEKWEKSYPEHQDLRMAFPVGLPQEPSRFQEYIQVFGDRHGFMPNLSVIDLLFNEGPNSGFYLRQLGQ